MLSIRHISKKPTPITAVCLGLTTRFTILYMPSKSLSFNADLINLNAIGTIGTVYYQYIWTPLQQLIIRSRRTVA